MYSFRKSKKGFTLIELMVVVAIIGILALLGLRLYTTQQAKAKESIVKANASTVHTIIQSEFADSNVDLSAGSAFKTGVLVGAGLRNPFSGLPMVDTDFVVELATAAAAGGTEGFIHINVTAQVTDESDATAVEIQGYGEGGDPIPEILTAQR